MSQTETLSRKQLASRFGVNVRTVDSWLAAGRIEHLKIGKTVRFTEQQVQKFEKSMTVKAVA